MTFGPFRLFRLRPQHPPGDQSSDGLPDSDDPQSHDDSLDDPSPTQSPSKVSRSGHPSVTCPSDPLTASPKPTLIRRVTSRLMVSIPSKYGLPSTKTLPSPTPETRSPRANTLFTPILPNGFISKDQREAALRERGLLPPRKDLSEQEREADKRLRCITLPTGSTLDGLTEAERLRAHWIATNRASEDCSSQWRPPFPPYLQGTGSRSLSSSPVPLDSDLSRRSSEGRMEASPVGRQSTSSSCPPLSSSSNLEVLPEEPSEQAPITPPLPSKFTVTISDSPPSPVIVDSPTSGSFLSHSPDSIPESSIPEKENNFSRPSRRSGERSRRVIKPRSLSTMGTRSFTNLRRSIAGSLRVPSSSSLSTGDVPHTPISAHLATAQAPRTAVSPTIHSLGSILWETKDIEDLESRRLSELAFLH